MQFVEFKEKYLKLTRGAPDLQATDVELAKMFLAFVVVEQDREELAKRELKRYKREG